MVDVNIDKEHRIKSDPYQYMLQRRRGINAKTGDIVWDCLGYFGTPEECLIEYKKSELKRSPSKTFQQMLDLAKELDKIVNNIIIRE